MFDRYSPNQLGLGRSAVISQHGADEFSEFFDFWLELRYNIKTHKRF